MKQQHQEFNQTCSQLILSAYGTLMLHMAEHDQLNTTYLFKSLDYYFFFPPPCSLWLEHHKKI